LILANIANIIRALLWFILLLILLLLINQQ